MSSSIEAAPTTALTQSVGMYNHPQMTYEEQHKFLLGGKYSLVDIWTDSDRYVLAGLIDSPSGTAWIHSWKGDTYFPQHPILWKNGNITAVDPYPDNVKRSTAVQWH
jgi:hypothetical protein